MKPKPPVTTQTVDERSCSGASPDVRDLRVQRSMTWTMTSTRRMVAAGEQHWWYRSTRSLLEMLITPHLPATVDDSSVYLDAGGGSGATGSWLADRATTVLDDFEPIALKAAVHDHAGYRGVQADINHVPHAIGCIRCSAVRHRAVPPHEPGSAGDRQRVRQGHEAGRSGVSDGAGRETVVAGPRRRHPHGEAIQPRRDAGDGPRRRVSISFAQPAPTRSWSHPRR